MSLSSDYFHIDGDLSREDCGRLADQAALKRIQFHQFRPSRRSLDLLNEIVFRRRKDVTLRVYGHGDVFADIDFLKTLPEVERFSWETDVFGSLEPLHHLKRLSALALGCCNAKKKKLSLSFLKEFAPTLEDLTLTGDYQDVEAVSDLNGLKRAWFVSAKFESYDFLSRLPLETFGTYGSRVKSLESIGRLTSLKWLWIKAHNLLTDVEFVRDLPHLEKLELLWLPKLRRLPDLSHLKKLRSIFVFQGKRFEDYSGALKLKNCHLSVSGPMIPNRFVSLTTP